MTPARIDRLELPAEWQPRAATLLPRAAADWLLIAISWWAMSFYGHWTVTTIGVVVIASRLHALGVILHDACHRSSRRSSAAWKLVEAVAGWPIASTTAAMRYHHLRHHRYSGTRLDPYRQPLQGRGLLSLGLLSMRGVMLPIWWTLRGFFAPVALLVPDSRNVYGRWFLQDRSQDDLRHSSEIVACARADLGQLAAQAIAVAVVIAFGLPFFTYYLLPLLLAGMLNAHRVAVEHSADAIETLTREALIATTNTNDAGWIGNWLLYPHNMGLHLAHHLYPGISFVHLPDVQSALQQGRSHPASPATG